MLLTVLLSFLSASYELDIKISWSGHIRDGSGATAAAANGQLHLPYLAEENDDEEPEVKVLLKTGEASEGGNAGQKFKDAILKRGKAVSARGDSSD